MAWFTNTCSPKWDNASEWSSCQKQLLISKNTDIPSRCSARFLVSDIKFPVKSEVSILNPPETWPPVKLLHNRGLGVILGVMISDRLHYSSETYFNSAFGLFLFLILSIPPKYLNHCMPLWLLWLFCRSMCILCGRTRWSPLNGIWNRVMDCRACFFCSFSCISRSALSSRVKCSLHGMTYFQSLVTDFYKLDFRA